MTLPRLLPMCVALTVALPPMAGKAGPVDGTMARELIRQAMAAQGLAAPQMPAPLRALPDCDHAPEVAAFRGDWSAAELTCTAPVPWRRVLRTGAASTALPQARGATAPARVAATVVVAARPLPRGTRIGAADLTTGPATGYAQSSSLATPELAVGRRLRVALGAGQALQERHLEPALDIEPGQGVTLVLHSAGVEISFAGAAETGGVVGDRIVVIPVSGQGRVEGWIMAPGLVSVRTKLPVPSAVKR